MATDLTTINVLLGIMAAVSRREALAVLSLFAAGALLYRRVLRRRVRHRRTPDGDVISPGLIDEEKRCHADHRDTPQSLAAGVRRVQRCP